MSVEVGSVHLKGRIERTIGNSSELTAFPLLRRGSSRDERAPSVSLSASLPVPSIGGGSYIVRTAAADDRFFAAGGAVPSAEPDYLIFLLVGGQLTFREGRTRSTYMSSLGCM